MEIGATLAKYRPGTSFRKGFCDYDFPLQTKDVLHDLEQKFEKETSQKEELNKRITLLKRVTNGSEGFQNFLNHFPGIQRRLRLLQNCEDPQSAIIRLEKLASSIANIKKAYASCAHTQIAGNTFFIMKCNYHQRRKEPDARTVKDISDSIEQILETDPEEYRSFARHTHIISINQRMNDMGNANLYGCTQINPNASRKAGKNAVLTHENGHHEFEFLFNIDELATERGIKLRRGKSKLDRFYSSSVNTSFNETYARLVEARYIVACAVNSGTWTGIQFSEASNNLYFARERIRILEEAPENTLTDNGKTLLAEMKEATDDLTKIAAEL